MLVPPPVPPPDPRVESLEVTKYHPSRIYATMTHYRNSTILELSIIVR